MHSPPWSPESRVKALWAGSDAHDDKVAAGGVETVEVPNEVREAPDLVGFGRGTVGAQDFWKKNDFMDCQQRSCDN